MNSKELKIRQAEKIDLDDLVQMISELFSIEADFTPDRARQREGLMLMLEDPDNKPVWIARQDGFIAGMCTLQVLVSTAQGTYVGLIEDMFVQPQFREIGVGRALLDHACSWAHKRGLTRIQLLCDSENEPALHFYQKTAWERTQLVAMRMVL